MDKPREANEEKYCGQGKSRFAQKNELLYRYYEHPDKNNDMIASFAKQSTTTEEAKSESDTQLLEFVEMERKETVNEVKIENLLEAKK